MSDPDSAGLCQSWTQKARPADPRRHSHVPDHDSAGQAAASPQKGQDAEDCQKGQGGASNVQGAVGGEGWQWQNRLGMVR